MADFLSKTPINIKESDFKNVSNTVGLKWKLKELSEFLKRKRKEIKSLKSNG